MTDFSDRYTVEPGAYKRHKQDQAVAADKQALHGRMLAAGAGLLSAGLLATGVGAPVATAAGAVAAGAVHEAKQNRREAIGDRMKGRAINDLYRRGKRQDSRDKSNALQTSDASGFNQANQNWEDQHGVHMGHASADAGNSSGGDNLKGWRNPNTQAAAQAALGHNYTPGGGDGTA